VTTETEAAVSVTGQGKAESEVSTEDDEEAK
jgi:hypothetical protein